MKQVEQPTFSGLFYQARHIHRYQPVREWRPDDGSGNSNFAIGHHFCHAQIPLQIYRFPSLQNGAR